MDDPHFKNVGLCLRSSTEPRVQKKKEISLEGMKYALDRSKNQQVDERFDKESVKPKYCNTA